MSPPVLVAQWQTCIRHTSTAKTFLGTDLYADGAILQPFHLGISSFFRINCLLVKICHSPYLVVVAK